MHNFILEGRKKLLLSGVKNVESFNDTDVIFFTELGELKIKGKELQIIKADMETGDVELTGQIDGVQYGNNKERSPNNFITKLFR